MLILIEIFFIQLIWQKDKTYLDNGHFLVNVGCSRDVWENFLHGRTDILLVWQYSSLICFLCTWLTLVERKTNAECRPSWSTKYDHPVSHGLIASSGELSDKPFRFNNQWLLTIPPLTAPERPSTSSYASSSPTAPPLLPLPPAPCFRSSYIRSLSNDNSWLSDSSRVSSHCIESSVLQ